jgi:hypothetical protein
MVEQAVRTQARAELRMGERYNRVERDRAVIIFIAQGLSIGRATAGDRAARIEAASFSVMAGSLDMVSGWLKPFWSEIRTGHSSFVGNLKNLFP